MAGALSRARPRWGALAAALGLAMLAHALALNLLGRLLRPPSLLSEVATPFYTRTLTPQTPAALIALAEGPGPGAATARPTAVLRPAPDTNADASPAMPARPASAPPPPAKPAPPAPKPAARPKPKPPPAAPAPPPDSATDNATTQAPSEPDPAPDSAPQPSPDTAPDTGPEPADASAGAASAPPAAETAPVAAASVASETASQTAAEAAPETTASAPGAAAADPAASAPASADTAAASDASGEPAFLSTWPANTRLRYRLGGYYRGELHGDAQVLWQREGTRYQAVVQLDVGILLSSRFTSQGAITAQGLRPEVYEEQIRQRRRGVRLGEDVRLNNGQRLPRPAADLQDAASQFVELAHRFATGRAALTPGSRIDFWLARPNGVDEWTYDVIGEETLHLPRLGPVQAFHLKPRRLSRPGGSISAEIWFAPSLQYLPVRIRLTQGTDTHMDLLVETVEQQ